MLEPGEDAPVFELRNQDGEAVRLSEYGGEQVVLYFYPKAGTPGCTAEACSFRDAWDEFEAAGATVLGVSTDPVEDLQPFREEHGLPFDLLSDEEGEVARRYDSFRTVEVDGETYDVAARNTFVIDEDGRIAAVYEAVSPEGHVEEILADL
jgi:peroxiredoxin Q/BCP